MRFGYPPVPADVAFNRIAGTVRPRRLESRARRQIARHRQHRLNTGRSGTLPFLAPQGLGQHHRLPLSRRIRLYHRMEDVGSHFSGKLDSLSSWTGKREESF